MRKTSSTVNRLLDSLVVQCWFRGRVVPGSIPSQGPRHTKYVIEMVPGSSLVQHSTLKREILALSQELRLENNVMDKIWYRNPPKHKSYGDLCDVHQRMLTVCKMKSVKHSAAVNMQCQIRERLSINIIIVLPLRIQILLSVRLLTIVKPTLTSCFHSVLQY